MERLTLWMWHSTYSQFKVAKDCILRKKPAPQFYMFKNKNKNASIKDKLVRASRKWAKVKRFFIK